MPNKFYLTPNAQSDLESIWNYTVDTWGVVQADNYVSKLFERFSWLAPNSMLGTRRIDIHEGYYSYRHAEHIVFYEHVDKGIAIIGVAHKSIDIGNFFD